MKHEVLSFEELRKSRKPIRNVNEIHQEHLSPSERFAIWITTHVGTMRFFAIIFFWTLIWLTWNTLGPSAARFDPFPGFIFWLFISNMIQIWLMAALEWFLLQSWLTPSVTGPGSSTRIPHPCQKAISTIP